MIYLDKYKMIELIYMMNHQISVVDIFHTNEPNKESASTSGLVSMEEAQAFGACSQYI